MRLLIVAAVFLFSCSLAAQTPTSSASTPSSDPLAVSLARQAVQALTAGQIVSDVTINANVTSIQGSMAQTGTAVFRAAGMGQSRVDLNLGGVTLSEARSAASGTVAGTWNKNGGTPVAQASHNLLTDASWFFPALSSLTQVANLQCVFKYVGQEQHNGVNTQHIQVSLAPVSGAPLIQQQSMMDFYLSATNSLPVAIDFNVHPDKDIGRDIPVEILFANYQAVKGVQIPYHFQKLLNGGVILDATVTSVNLNTGLAATAFSLP